MKAPNYRHLVKAGLDPATISVVLPESACPVCGAALNRASGVEETDIYPASGDWTLCGACGALLAFTDDLRHRIVTQEELDVMTDAQRRELQNAQRILSRVARKWD